MIVCSGSEAYISNCEFSGEVSGASAVGGVSGYASSSEWMSPTGEGYPIILTSCKVTGTLRASSSYLGSMVGVFGYEFAGDILVDDCEFTGKAYLQSVENVCDFVGYIRSR